MYGVPRCVYSLESGSVAQEDLAIKIVMIDQFIMFCFLMGWICLSFYVTYDTMKHTDNKFQTKEFAIQIVHLP